MQSFREKNWISFFVNSLFYGVLPVSLTPVFAEVEPGEDVQGGDAGHNHHRHGGQGEEATLLPCKNTSACALTDNNRFGDAETSEHHWCSCIIRYPCYTGYNLEAGKSSSTRSLFCGNVVTQTLTVLVTQKYQSIINHCVSWKCPCWTTLYFTLHHVALRGCLCVFKKCTHLACRSVCVASKSFGCFDCGWKFTSKLSSQHFVIQQA